MDGPITFDEFKTAIQSLKNNKAPGNDFITNEDIKQFLLQESEDLDSFEFSDVVLNILFNLMAGFWEYERIPSGLKKVILRPFLKNKDKDEYAPENYRTISLLNTLFKLYEAIIHNRLVCYLEKELLLSPVQAGYRPKKSTVDHILVLQELFLEYRFNKIGKRGGRNKKALYLCFLDLVKAFDKVSREYLFRKLYQIGISGRC